MGSGEICVDSGGFLWVLASYGWFWLTGIHQKPPELTRIYQNSSLSFSLLPSFSAFAFFFISSLELNRF